MFWWKNKSIWICFMRCGINLPYSLPRPRQGYWKVHWLAVWMPNDTGRIGKLNIYAMFLYAPTTTTPIWILKCKTAAAACKFYTTLYRTSSFDVLVASDRAIFWRNYTLKSWPFRQFIWKFIEEYFYFYWKRKIARSPARKTNVFDLSHTILFFGLGLHFFNRFFGRFLVLR